MIPNFHPVIDGKVYRGGQPYLPSHWQELQARGIKTVVKLNFRCEGIDDAAEQYGIKVLDFPMQPITFFQGIFGAPEDDEVAAAVAAICDEGNWPLFVHCLHGQDRTGLVTAEFRVVKQGWPIEQARGEMLLLGYHIELIDLDRVWHRFVASRRG